jgi:hypothetical protein
MEFEIRKVGEASKKAVVSQGTRLSVVIPALNEQEGITEIVQNVLATEPVLRRLGITSLEVIVVDDGSADGTSDRVARMNGVRLVRHTHNRGYGAALKTGFREATGDLLAFLDADGTYPPDRIAELCSVALKRSTDLVIGSRRSGAFSKMPPLRRLGNWIWSTLLSVIGGEKVRDPASGMRVFWRRCLRRLYPLPDGLNFTPVMSTRALHEGLRVVEIPIPYRERAGRSKLKVVRDGIRFLLTILWTALQYNPGRILEFTGACAMCAAFAGGVALVAVRLAGVTTLDAWGVLWMYIGLVLAVGGASAFALGLAANRLVSHFHKSPVRQPNLLTRFMGASPETHFHWVGLALAAAGIAAGGVSVTLALQGWDVQRLWLWLLGSALMVLVGIQLSLFWMLTRVLDTLAQRDTRIEADVRKAPNAAYLVSEALRPVVTAPRA